MKRDNPNSDPNPNPDPNWRIEIKGEGIGTEHKTKLTGSIFIRGEKGDTACNEDQLGGDAGHGGLGKALGLTHRGSPGRLRNVEIRHYNQQAVTFSGANWDIEDVLISSSRKTSRACAGVVLKEVCI